MYDSIVIGSGVAGMTAAITLAQYGERVAIFEQARAPGGLMATYARAGASFPTGVHCLGSMMPGGVLRKCLQRLGVFERLRIVPMTSPQGSHVCHFPGLTVSIPSDRQAYRQRLIDLFPDEASAVDRFLGDMARVVRCFPLYTLHDAPAERRDAAPAISLRSYLEGITRNAKLASVLSALTLLVGLAPGECPLHVYFLVLDSFLSGACRIDERRASLAASFASALEACGGTIRTGARVVRILYDGAGTRGVRLASGEEVGARTVVFTGHPRQLLELCQDKGLRPAFLDRLRDAPDTPGAFGICLKWNRPPDSLSRADAVLYDVWDLDRHCSQSLLSGTETVHAVYCSGTAAEESEAASVTAFCLSRLGEWSPWADSRTGQRPASYHAAKKAAGDRLMSVLEQQWPGARAEAEIVDSFTPLTFRDYTLASGGTAFGLKKTNHVYMPSQTRIHGLYLAGQSIILSGVLGSVISAIRACQCILPAAPILADIRNHTA